MKRSYCDFDKRSLSVTHLNLVSIHLTFSAAGRQAIVIHDGSFSRNLSKNEKNFLLVLSEDPRSYTA